MLRTIAVVVLVSSLALPSNVAAGFGDTLHTWCMTGWAGDVCFDVTNFRVREGQDVRVDGAWRQPGLPAEGVFDDLGRWRPTNGLFTTIGLFDLTHPVSYWDCFRPNPARPTCYPDHQLVSAELYHGPIPASGPFQASTWETPHCYVPGRAGGGYTVSWNDGRCAAVSVPEPGTLLLLATGLVGITAAARRRKHVS